MSKKHTLHQYLNFDENDSGEYFRYETVRRNKLWLTNPKFLNDPQEFKYYFGDELPIRFGDPQAVYEFLNTAMKNPKSIGLGHSIISSKYLDDLVKLYGNKFYDETHLNEIFNLAIELDHLAVACLSESENNPLMWAHYGRGHTGFCVTYEFTERERQWSHVYGEYMNHVNYTSRQPSINYWDVVLGNAFEKICCTKSGEWSYEKEVRYITTIANPTLKGLEINLPYDMKITEITAGAKVDANKMALLMKLRKELSEKTGTEISLCITELDNRTYDLAKVKVN